MIMGELIVEEPGFNFCSTRCGEQTKSVARTKNETIQPLKANDIGKKFRESDITNSRDIRNGTGSWSHDLGR